MISTRSYAAVVTLLILNMVMAIVMNTHDAKCDEINEAGEVGLSGVLRAAQPGLSNMVNNLSLRNLNQSLRFLTPGAATNEATPAADTTYDGSNTRGSIDSV
jgi:hypothetical protein